MKRLFVHLTTEGEIDFGPKELPENWENVSGLPHLSDLELAELNWHHCSGEVPSYNSTWQTLSLPTAILDSNGEWRAEWVVSFRPKETILSRRNQEIDDLREENIARGAIVDLDDSNGPFTVQTRGELDTRNITGLAGVATTSLLLNQPFSADFRDQDDQVHTLNAQQVLMLQAQIAVWVQSHYYVAWAHKANLKALHDADDLQGMVDYDTTQGWP